MRAIAEATFDVPVLGGDLRVFSWGEGPVVLAAHGITASAVMWGPIAERVAGDVRLVAPDLRGRGGSARLPGPYGMTAHAEDMLGVLDHLGVERAVVAGASMGGYAAVVLAGRHPERVSHLVLVDGGIPLPAPPAGVDPDAALDAMLGPAIARLRQTFGSREAYLDFWRVHPALKDDWNGHIEAYLDYDVEGPPDALRSKVSEAAVRADGRDVLTSTVIADALRVVRCPITLLRAPRGLMNEPTPLIPDALLAQWELPGLSDRLVEDVNHYTLVLSDRGSSAVADAIIKATKEG